jgi:hypothetical protein
MARFIRDVLNGPDRADEVEDEDLESYAERKRLKISNPRRKLNMANGGDGHTKQDLLNEIDEFLQENQDLQTKLDAIADIISGVDDRPWETIEF